MSIQFFTVSATGNQMVAFQQSARAVGYPYSYIGENIFAGRSIPKEVVNGWMNSSEHRANILNPNYQEIGVGYYYLANDTGRVNYKHYWK